MTNIEEKAENDVIGAEVQIVNEIEATIGNVGAGVEMIDDGVEVVKRDAGVVEVTTGGTDRIAGEIEVTAENAGKDTAAGVQKSTTEIRMTGGMSGALPVMIENEF